ncbi:hypothetical protein AURDEDRAFT_165507 [Auricularia subglabra TFB-10046 SS5]|nr:hypothetical protein AURDEDRAFT_165507 [Auricularia subglabra TFB-10046 SS5]
MKIRSFPPSPERASVSRVAPRETALLLPELVRMYFLLLPNTGVLAICMSVCTTWHMLGGELLQPLHDIGRGLRPFISNVPALRRLLCEMDGVIAGTFADLFFRRGPGAKDAMLSPTYALELYFESIYRDDVLERLLAEGYALEDEFEVGDTFPDSAVTALVEDSYYGLMRFRKGARRIEVVLASESTANCVLHVETTGAMNFVTWDSALCMFAHDVLILEESLCLRLDYLPEGVPEARTRGLDCQRWPEGSSSQLLVRYPPAWRWVGDVKCWTVELETNSVLYDVAAPSESDEMLVVPSTYCWSVNGFTMTYAPAAGPPTTKSHAPTLLALPIQGCHLLANPALLYTYAVAPDLARAFRRYVSLREEHEGQFWVSQNVRVDEMLLDFKDYLLTWTA